VNINYLGSRECDPHAIPLTSPQKRKNTQELRMAESCPEWNTPAILGTVLGVVGLAITVLTVLWPEWLIILIWLVFALYYGYRLFSISQNINWMNSGAILLA
jgi:hypothetical protein